MGSPVQSNARRAYAACALVALVTVAVHANTLGNGFVYDDRVIAAHAHLQDPWRLAETFGGPLYRTPANDIDVYRPLTAWSLAWNAWLDRLFGGSGLRPAAFHLGNLLLAAGASVAALVALVRLGIERRAALVAVLLWSVLPIRTEAIASVYNRSEVLAALFGLSFLALHRAGRATLAGVCLLLALLSKESAIAFAPLALVADALLPRDGRRLHPRAWLAPAVAVAVFLAARAHALVGVSERPVLLENPAADAPGWVRVLTALRVQLDYLRLQVWPAGLSSDWSYDAIPLVRSPADPRVLGFLLVVAAAAALAWRTRRTRPEVGLAVAGYAILFAPTCNVLLPIGTILGERLAFAPSLMTCLLAAIGWAALRERARPAADVALALALAAGAARTVAQNRVWKDELTLFRDQVVAVPRSARAHLNLGMVLQRGGQDAEAAAEVQRSLEIYPGNSEAWYVLGLALYNLRAEPVRVIEAFQQALRYGPANHDARAKLGLVFARCGRPAEARQVAAELARLAPGHPGVAQIEAALRQAGR